VVSDTDDVKLLRRDGTLTPGGYHLRDQLLDSRWFPERRRLQIAGLKPVMDGITKAAILIPIVALVLVVVAWACR
jgi:hypothetical protein